MENTLNSRKNGDIIIVYRKYLILFRCFVILVTQDGGKLSRVGELSVAEPLQGR